MNLSITISTPGSKFAPIVFQGEYDKQIINASSVGYEAVELHIRDPKAIARRELFQALNKTNIRVSTIGTGQAYVDERIFFTSFDENIRQAAVQRIKDQIDLAAELNAKVIIGTIKGPLPETKSEKGKARGLAIQCLKECLEYADSFNVKLTLEAINRYETNFLNTAEETVNFINEIGSENLGLHLDTFHMNIEEISIEETVRAFRNFIFHIHIADSNRLPPGKGHLNFRSIIRELEAVGYSGSLGIECLPIPSSFVAAKQAFEYMGSLLS